jgi:hypothetical protein
VSVAASPQSGTREARVNKAHLLSRASVPLVAGICLLAFVIGTRHWTLISDAVLMHYVGFLVRHGFAPYRDIADINMPGTYLLDLAWTSLVGSGAVAARL